MSRRSVLRISIEPSPSSGDHQVRLFVDERDLVSELGALGLDPDDFFLPTPRLLPSEVPATERIARCSCGVVGCGDVMVKITTQHPWIEWTLDGIGDLRFVHADYAREVLRADADATWETPDRTTARLVRERLDDDVRAHLATLGLRFEWSSGRVVPGAFVVSLSGREGQELVHVKGDGEPEVVASRVLDALRRKG